MFYLKFSIFLLIISSSACSSLSVKNIKISDEKLKKKAAKALFTTEDKISISNKQNNPNPTNSIVNSIRFIAMLNKKQYLCFLQTSGNIIISDAICSGSELLNINISRM